MPIIIDNFFVNTNAPIDNRFVVGPGLFYLTKDDINYKYVGLRVWDSNNSVPYYWDGTQWLSENSIGVLADTNSTLAGESNYISKFTSGPTVIGKSIIYENPASNQIGIGLIGNSIDANTPSGQATINGLHVAGNIRTNNYFVGSGLHVTDINATNINSGLLSIARISHLSNTGNSLPNGNYVLTNFGFGSSVIWSLTNTLSVLSSTNTTNITITEDSISTNSYITFVNATSGQLPLKINSSKMQFRPDNGQLLLSDGSATEPVYSFLNSASNGVGKAGIYYSNSNGVSTSIQGNEITSVRTYGLVVNNRIYVQVSSNNTDVGYGIVWLANGPSNDININDGFPYNTQRLNYYGIGSHIPTDSSIATGRGTYIAGYFGVDIFSGNRLKLKVNESNDVSIFSRLNLNNIETLQSSINSNIVLSTMQNSGGSDGNNVVIKDWSVRSNTGTDWLTWKHHNGITVDNVWATPNGPDTGQVTASGTLTFWERHPYIHEQYFGSVNRKTLTINSSNPTTQNPFVKVDGNLLVGSSTTISPVTSSGNIVIGSGNLLVGTNTIVPSAIVDFTSTTKGVLLPRMTTTQRTAIVNPPDGLTIYNTITKALNTYTSAIPAPNLQNQPAGWLNYITTIAESLNVGTSAVPITTGGTSTYANGYLKLGNGLIIQWCKVKNGTNNYYFPVVINVCLVLQITSDRGDDGARGYNHGQALYNSAGKIDRFRAVIDSYEGWMFSIGM